MGTLNLDYSTPKNRTELENLFGDIVRIKLNRIAPSSPMVYFGIKNHEIHGDLYQFLKQGQRRVENGSDSGIDDDYREFEDFVPTQNIHVWKNPVDSVMFYDDGIVLASNKLYMNICAPNSKDYKDAQRLLQRNGLWRNYH